MVEKRKYLKASLDQISLTAETFSSGSADEEIKRRIEEIIAQEAPVMKEILVKRLINSLSLYKAGAIIAEHIDALLSQMDLDEEDEVFYSGRDISFFRPSNEDENNFRYSYQIPPVEAENAIIYIYENNGNKCMKKKDVLVSFSSLMGYQRKGSEVRSLFEKAFVKLRKDGRIISRSSGFSLS